MGKFPRRDRVFKSNGSSNQGFVSDFCAIDFSGGGAPQAMRVRISPRNVILPCGLPKTIRTTKEQYQLRFCSKLAGRRWYPLLALAPTSLFNLHFSFLSMFCSMLCNIPRSSICLPHAAFHFWAGWEINQFERHG